MAAVRQGGPREWHDATLPKNGGVPDVVSLLHHSTVPLPFARRINLSFWNIGGRGDIGLEANLDHIVEAVSPRGPLACNDVLLLAESKLRDFTLIDAVGLRLHRARTHRDCGGTGSCTLGAACHRRVTILASTMSSIAPSTAMAAPLDSEDVSSAAMAHERRPPWGGLVALMLNEQLRGSYIGISKLGLLTIRVQPRPDPAPHDQHYAPLTVFVVYNPNEHSKCNTIPGSTGALGQSALLMQELQTRVTEAQRRAEHVIVAGDFNARLGAAAIIPTASTADSSDDEDGPPHTFPVRATADSGAQRGARGTMLARVCSALALTPAHGSLPHHAPGCFTSRSVVNPASRGTTEVDYILVPWRSLRAAVPAQCPLALC